MQVYEKNSFTSSFMYFAFILSERITITSSEEAEEALKVCEHNFFQKKYKRKRVSEAVAQRCSVKEVS